MNEVTPASTADEQDLAALQWNWGEAYLIGYDDDHGWWASRRDQIGGLITEAGPDELRAAIIADYDLKPVPRVHVPPDAGAVGRRQADLTRGDLALEVPGPAS